MRSVADFDDSESVKDCNAPTNLVGLCPNCHWEFDNGLLKLQ
ncbi:MAG: HNH endonuclease [Candidatus Thorarchaeota archaeon]